MNKKILLLTIITAVITTAVATAVVLLNRDSIHELDSSNQTSTVKTDAEKFSEEYPSVPNDNKFVYRDIDQIIKIMKNGTGVVYLGFPDCPWCQAYVKYLDEVAKETNLNTIYYFNIFEDRSNNTEKYKEIVALLGDHLQYDEEGNYRVFVPNVSFHVEGELIGNDYESSKDTLGYDSPEDYWTSERIESLKNTLRTYTEQVVNALGNCEKTCDL